MEIDKKYDHLSIEKKWYQFWEEKGFFKADPSSKKPPYTIVLPPPNVTGVLHMGHAVMVVVQDAMSRYKRMSGYDVLWLPDTDHAGIATQMVVERALNKEGISRHDLGREKFLERVWKWKKENGSTITRQLRCLGASLDWSRERFTMDENLSKAVREVFVSLYEEGLIYKNTYIINWCPHCRTALSDLEVDHENVEGHLWHIKYPIVGSDEFLTIATTRPETLLGDSAVAVHPEDKRYAHLIGKKVKLPLSDREIPIIGDPILVDIEFGTGAVKVTPAHDFNDFETGKRHNLEEINVINEKGEINELGGKYAGMTTTEAREAIVADLDKLGLLLKVEKHMHAVGHCQRCKTIVEPILSDQWFLKMEDLAKPAIEAVETGKIVFQPETWKKTYYEWMYNIKDWCISRQLWWGHQIPVWYCEDCGEMIVSREDPTKCTKCGSTKLRRDSDVLDTWFSSQLLPFSTLGWPEKTPELAKYYPTTLMETGFDIIFFWVARMIMMGYKFMGEKPFGKVFFHGLVRDKFGQKMSKSKGNVVDPLVVTEKYGADALRFTFAMISLSGRDVKLSDEWFEGYWAFINKIYNATRFCLMQFAEGEKFDGFNPITYKEDNFSFADKWILSKLETATADVRKNLDEMRLNDAAGAIYHFFWHEFCDWYIELVKPTFFGTDENAKTVSKKVLLKVLDASLKLLHPFMPHVTEELWQSLPFSFDGREESIMISRFPELGDCPVFERDAQTMEEIIEIITVVRTIRAENNIKPSAELTLKLSLEESLKCALSEKLEYIIKLARVKNVEFVEGFTPDKETASAIVKGGTLYIPLAGLVDFSDEIKRLEKEIAKIQKDFDLCDKKLNNPNFLSKAQPEVVEKEKAKHTELSENLAHLKARLAEIK